MDFITGLPTLNKYNDAIMVVVEKLRKFNPFHPCQFDLQGNRYHPGIHEGDIQIAWYAERDCV
jgi:hypothetical protein